MSSDENQYLNLLNDILINGVECHDRTGVGTKELFGKQMTFDLSKGFPLLTTKRVYLKGVIHELLWILKGDTNIKYLQDNNVHIWDEWADEDGELGPVYGKQWRAWETNICRFKIDQIKNVVRDIKKNPSSRRLIVSAWNPVDVDRVKLPPCHTLFQFNVQKNKLNCMLHQRSGDMFLGIPFNIASYSLLTMMIAQVCNLEPGVFVHNIGSAHIYMNHIDQVNEQLKRVPFDFPQMNINPEIRNIDDFKYEDFEIVGYNCHPSIKAPVAV